MANEYVTEADFSTILPSADSDLLSICREASSRAIDNYTERFFYDSITSKTYPADAEIIIDDLQSVTSVIIDTDDALAAYVNIDSTDYYCLFPENSTPKTKIQLSETGVNVVITGTFGYGSVPLPVKQACMMLTRQLYSNAFAGELVSERTQTYSYKMAEQDAQGLSPTVKMLLAPYKRI